MKIEHLAVWTQQPEVLRDFYTRFFGAGSGERYHNATKQFSSYFLSFEGGARLELMQMPGIITNVNGNMQLYAGLAHFAISTGSKEQVDALTATIRAAGYPVLGETEVDR